MDVSCPDAGPSRSPAFIFRNPNVIQQSFYRRSAFAAILLSYKCTTSINQHTLNAATPHSCTFVSPISDAIFGLIPSIVAFLLSPIPGGNPVHNHRL